MPATELTLGLAALLGALQGVAEFLPISSSGHLALAQRVAGLDAGAGGHSFNIVVHAGTLLAVLIHYRDDLLAIARGVLRPGHARRSMSISPGLNGHAPSGSTAGRGAPDDSPAAGASGHASSSSATGHGLASGSSARAPSGSSAATGTSGHPPSGSPAATGTSGHPPSGSPAATGTSGHAPSGSSASAGAPGHASSGSSATDSRALLLALVIATLPLAAALAPPVENLVIAAEHHPKAIGACFLVTAAMLGFAHWRSLRQQRPQEVPRPLQALVIGLAQLVAILPGISRSGSTIAAAMGLGLGRLPAARFSFLLAIPAILGASLKEALDLMKEGLPAVDPLAFVVGFLVSFVVGVATLRVLLVLLVRVGVLPFVPYLLVLGIAVLALG